MRPAGVPLAGLAEFPGGKVHDDETAAAAAVRECREETGLQVVVDREFFSTIHRYDHGLLEIQFFLCRLAPRIEGSSPISPFRWVTADELAMLEFPAANAPRHGNAARQGKSRTSIDLTAVCHLCATGSASAPSDVTPTGPEHWRSQWHTASVASRHPADSVGLPAPVVRENRSRRFSVPLGKLCNSYMQTIHDSNDEQHLIFEFESPPSVMQRLI